MLIDGCLNPFCLHRDLLLEVVVSRVPLQLLWKQCGSSLQEDGQMLLDYIHVQLTEATALSYELPEIKRLENRLSDDNETNQSNTPSGYEVYVAMTTADNLQCLQELFTEHAQCVSPTVIAVATAEEHSDEQASLKVHLRIYLN